MGDSVGIDDIENRHLEKSSQNDDDDAVCKRTRYPFVRSPVN
jgi:hypothetical protein